MVKSLSELEKSHSWRFGSQRSETFSRVAELRLNTKYAQIMKKIIVFLFVVFAAISCNNDEVLYQSQQGKEFTLKEVSNLESIQADIRKCIVFLG